jgi:hypothetical protein
VEPVLEPTPGEASHIAACHYPLERWPADGAELRYREDAEGRVAVE